MAAEFVWRLILCMVMLLTFTAKAQGKLCTKLLSEFYCSSLERKLEIIELHNVTLQPTRKSCVSIPTSEGYYLCIVLVTNEVLNFCYPLETRVFCLEAGEDMCPSVEELQDMNMPTIPYSSCCTQPNPQIIHYRLPTNVSNCIRCGMCSILLYQC